MPSQPRFSMRSPRVLRTFGKYSYALYVVHLPVVILLMVPPGGYFGVSGTATYLIYFVVMVGLSFAVALARWHLIELPFLKLKREFADGSGSAKAD